MNEKICYMSKTKVIILCSKAVEKLSASTISSLPISKDEYKGIKALLDMFSNQPESLDEDMDLNYLYLELKDVFSRVAVKDEKAYCNH